MAFVLLPLNVGDTILATQFNEARDSVEERSHTVGNVTALPNAVVGAVLTAVTPIAFINDLRQRIEDMVNGVGNVGLLWVNPNSDDTYFDLAEFFTAANIGDFNNWTRVPARKGGLTVSSRLVKGDTIFVEHINEIRLAVIELGRVRWTMRFGPFDTLREATRVGLAAGLGNSGAVWIAVRQAAIAAANAVTPVGLSFVGPPFAPLGFGGNGDGLTFPLRREASVNLGQSYLDSVTPVFGASAPSPMTYANVRLESEFNFSSFTNAPPPSQTGLLEVRIVTPLSSLTFPPTTGSWSSDGVQWATFVLSNGTKIVTALDASQLPDNNPDVDFVLAWKTLSEGVDRINWPNPADGGQSSSDQQSRMVVPQFVDADVTNFSFQ